ncbi:hypothetical protein AVEN_110015-1 [Araneus ventricosus]|uniref:Uncharacterized protein n=1 Tax=Araneus ventricosus TaxID=182803 RepID=A0A4Y2JB33_ARAVE|nr:hypothetical protein AVEN_110015-1 [Araneus ventricosus]
MCFKPLIASPAFYISNDLLDTNFMCVPDLKRKTDLRLFLLKCMSSRGAFAEQCRCVAEEGHVLQETQNLHLRFVDDRSRYYLVTGRSFKGQTTLKPRKNGVTTVKFDTLYL